MARPAHWPPGARRQLLSGLLGLLVLSLLAAGIAAAQLWNRAAPADAPSVEVEIPRGASIRAAAERLRAAGVIGNARAFELLARALGDGRDIRYGSYVFPAGDGWSHILGKMQRGDVLTIRITIPEGMPAVLVAERLNAAPRLSGDEVQPPAEGSVLPDTYVARVGAPRAEVLARMQQAMTAELDRLWAKRSAGAVVQTREQAVTLASIVEKESGLASERRHIAGLYSNRLRRGMPLQADPTVIYPVTKGRPLGRRILQSELQADNGYNTYRNPGLPKGPITNPGRESLEAVLNPEATDDLYMVADGSGGHAFARDYAGHQANVAKWRAFRRDKGI